jgi:hypothetical protein
MDRARFLSSGERRLPACPSRQLAETLSGSTMRKNIFRRQMLPARCRQLQAGSLRSPEFASNA